MSRLLYQTITDCHESLRADDGSLGATYVKSLAITGYCFFSYLIPELFFLEQLYFFVAVASVSARGVRVYVTCFFFLYT